MTDWTELKETDPASKGKSFQEDHSNCNCSNLSKVILLNKIKTASSRVYNELSSRATAQSFIHFGNSILPMLHFLNWNANRISMHHKSKPHFHSYSLKRDRHIVRVKASPRGIKWKVTVSYKDCIQIQVNKQWTTPGHFRFTYMQPQEFSVQCVWTWKYYDVKQNLGEKCCVFTYLIKLKAAITQGLISSGNWLVHWISPWFGILHLNSLLLD